MALVPMARRALHISCAADPPACNCLIIHPTWFSPPFCRCRSLCYFACLLLLLTLAVETGKERHSFGSFEIFLSETIGSRLPLRSWIPGNANANVTSRGAIQPPDLIDQQSKKEGKRASSIHFSCCSRPTQVSDIVLKPETTAHLSDFSLLVELS